MLIARIYNAFPSECSACGATLRIFAFVAEAAPIRQILEHFGEPHESPPVRPPGNHATGPTGTKRFVWMKTSTSTGMDMNSINFFLN
jgi:hypothetical protein